MRGAGQLPLPPNDCGSGLLGWLGAELDGELKLRLLLDHKDSDRSHCAVWGAPLVMDTYNQGCWGTPQRGPFWRKEVD